MSPPRPHSSLGYRPPAPEAWGTAQLAGSATPAGWYSGGRNTSTTSGTTFGGRSTRLDGVLSTATEAGREVAATADKGFPWEASVGIAVVKL